MNFERLKKINEQRQSKKITVNVGQRLKIYEWVGEGNNRRIRRFEGLVIKVKKSNSVDGSFTIRGKTSGITVEKIYPLSFINFHKVELLDEYKVRRAKLYYIRDKVGKDARLKTIIAPENRGKLLASDVVETPVVEAVNE